MKSVLITSLVAALLGLGFGAGLAYVEVPAAISVLPIPELPQDDQGKSVLPKAAPKAEVPETLFEFGKIERGTSMSHVFKIRNVGEKPLRVEVTSTTCKCTVGDLSKKEIGPDEESEVTLEWVAKTGPGPFRHGAVLSTNDPSQSSINLTVEGQVVESTAMSPAELFLGTVSAGESSTAELYLMAMLDEEIEVLDYELSNPELAEQIEINITKADADELPSEDAVRGLKVSATYQSGKMIGPVFSWLTLKTNLKKAEELTVPITATVVGDVSIFGPGWNDKKGLLRLGTLASSEGKKVALKVVVRGKHSPDTKFEVVESDPPELQVSLGEPRQLRKELLHVPLEIEIPAGTTPMIRLGEPVSSEARVVLRSDSEKIPEVRLRVQFAVE